jgi:hypothetical protein
MEAMQLARGRSALSGQLRMAHAPHRLERRLQRIVRDASALTLTDREAPLPFRHRKVDPIVNSVNG